MHVSFSKGTPLQFLGRYWGRFSGQKHPIELPPMNYRQRNTEAPYAWRHLTAWTATLPCSQPGKKAVTNRPNQPGWLVVALSLLGSGRKEGRGTGLQLACFLLSLPENLSPLNKFASRGSSHSGRRRRSGTAFPAQPTVPPTRRTD